MPIIVFIKAIIIAKIINEETCFVNKKDVAAGAANNEIINIAPTTSKAVTTQIETSVIRI